MAQVPAAVIETGPEPSCDLLSDTLGSLYVSVDFHGITVFALVDSGSTISVIHPDVLTRIPGMVDADIEHPGGEPTKVKCNYIWANVITFVQM